MTLQSTITPTEIKSMLLACGWPERSDPCSHPVKEAVWAAILRSADIKPSWANGPWVSAGISEDEFVVTGLSHLPAVAQALTQAGIASTQKVGMILVSR